MDRRHRVARLHDVEENRTSADLRELLKVLPVFALIGRGQSHLHETFIASSQYTREREAGVIGHQVRHHWSTVVVALHTGRTVGSQTLRGPAARPRIHRFVEQATNLALLALGGWAILRFLDSHNVSEQ